MERMLVGGVKAGEVADIAAELLANPPPLVAAARRYQQMAGTKHEGAAAVALLELLVDGAAADRDLPAPAALRRT
jgi:hypothetical protein